MKLATLMSNNRPVAVVITEKGFAPVAQLLPGAPEDIQTLIGVWDEYGVPLTEAVRLADEARWESYDRNMLLAPITRPNKIMAIGLNYIDHVSEIGFTAPEHQLWFSKQSNSVNGPYANVHMPRNSSEVDYEVELVAIIGKRGRHIAEQDAREHIFGYCVGNDVSARDWQMRTPQWVLGKSFDTHAPFGPWLTTADEVENPHELNISCSVNGEVRQHANTNQMCFNVWAQISHLSEVMTLEPGDVIFTGTPAGVGMGMKPPQYLSAGDIVRCDVDKLGFLENAFIPEPRDSSGANLV